MSTASAALESQHRKRFLWKIVSQISELHKRSAFVQFNSNHRSGSGTNCEGWVFLFCRLIRYLQRLPNGAQGIEELLFSQSSAYFEGRDFRAAQNLVMS